MHALSPRIFYIFTQRKLINSELVFKTSVLIFLSKTYIKLEKLVFSA